MKKILYLCISLLFPAAMSASAATAQGIVIEAGPGLALPAAAAAPSPETLSGVSPAPPAVYRPPFKVIEPIRLFDDLYFVGTTTVGVFVVDTGDGLVMLDAGIGDEDAPILAAGMRKLGLDPGKIRLILISHEHFDHYGGARYFRKNVCPEAKVALSLVGWNMLQTAPLEIGYLGPRLQKVDIYLTDGMKIRVGRTAFQIVATPGHSMGCMSFIFPVHDNGKAHMVGMMGGSSVWTGQTESRSFKASIEYFKAFTHAAGCDVGLAVHSAEADFAATRARKAGEAHPLVVGRQRYDTVYLEKFRNMYRNALRSGKMQPYPDLISATGVWDATGK